MASFGENLRRERELRGVSLREIADATKISVRFLEALENDRVHILPGGVFRRAFVREYARHLGLDAERLVAEFVFAHGAEPAAEPVRAGGAPNRGPLVVAAFLMVLVPLLLGKVWREQRAARSAATPTPAAAASAVERVYPTPAPSPAAEEQRLLSADAGGLALTLSAKEQCWVSVRADGQSVLNRVLSKGETETVQARGEIVLSVGNAGGIDFSVDDRQGLSLGRSGEVRRNIVITRESLPALVEGATPRSAPTFPHS